MSENDTHNPTAPTTSVDKLLTALRELTGIQRAAAALLAVFACFVIYDQIYFWLNREDYEFGFLVPVFVLYVISDRWPQIRALTVGDKGEPEFPIDPKWKRTLAGVLMYSLCILALAMLACGTLLRMVMGINEISSVFITLGFGLFWISIAYCVGAVDAQGRLRTVADRLHLSGLFTFPAFSWLVSAPMLIIFESRVKLWLLALVTTVVFGLFDFLGYPIEQVGNVLVLPNGSVGVADACSGIRSLTGCLFAGSFLAAIYFKTWGRKIFLLVAAGCLAVFTNILRSLFLTAWAYCYGPEAIEGTVHDVTGYSVLAVTGVLLLVLVNLMNRQWIPTPEDDEPSTPPQSS